MNIKKYFKLPKSFCCGLGAKFSKKCNTEGACSTSKCCPCKCILKTIALLLVLFLANTYLGFSNLAIKRYIDNNPKQIISSIEKMMKDERDGKGKKAVENVGKVLQAISANEHLPYLGQKDAKNVIVEFFDYNCGYCRKANTDVNKLVKNRADVKVILVNTPIMSEASLVAAQASIAVFAVEPSKFEDFHHRLMSAKAQVSIKDVEAALMASVKGEKLKQVKDLMAGKEIETEIQTVYEQIQAIGAQGTPAFIVNGKFIPGYVSYDEIVAVLK